MSARRYPSARYLRQCFKYKNGKLFWRERPLAHFTKQNLHRRWNSRYAGKEAGSLSTIGRYVIGLDGRRYYRYRLVWALFRDEWPPRLDHKNRNSYSDSLSNLRVATHKQNLCNRGKSKNNTSGYKGVCWDKENDKWIAQIRSDGRNFNLGRFSTITAARDAYVKAAKHMHGKFACV